LQNKKTGALPGLQLFLLGFEGTLREEPRLLRSIDSSKVRRPGGAVTIPSAIAGLPVAAIADSVLAGQPNLTSVTFPGRSPVGRNPGRGSNHSCRRNVKRDGNAARATDPRMRPMDMAQQ